MNKEKVVTHDHTRIVNDAIEKHGSPFLKTLSKGEPLVQDFCYRPGTGFIKFGTVAANGRLIPCYRKGIMRLRGEVKEHINSLPKAQKDDLWEGVKENLFESLDTGIDQKQLLLQAFNQKVQTDINAAVVASGEEAFAFEQEYVNGAGFDARVFVMMFYDGYMPSEERLDEIQATNERRKIKRMSDATKGNTIDGRTNADYAKA